ncbi:hypothetical protein C7M84_025177 [Penaeus vannamei]|uniref:Uncharacterized protein n=1 Tax=Penaeus vannamei TaxID=6689 RepID=A0A423TZ27_PENVA|nr:hypothetical protein C7M84_025177 [Penaeus vannamei]
MEGLVKADCCLGREGALCGGGWVPKENPRRSPPDGNTEQCEAQSDQDALTDIVLYALMGVSAGAARGMPDATAPRRRPQDESPAHAPAGGPPCPPPAAAPDARPSDAAFGRGPPPAAPGALPHPLQSQLRNSNVEGNQLAQMLAQRNLASMPPLLPQQQGAAPVAGSSQEGRRRPRQPRPPRDPWCPTDPHYRQEGDNEE